MSVVGSAPITVLTLPLACLSYSSLDIPKPHAMREVFKLLRAHPGHCLFLSFLFFSSANGYPNCAPALNNSMHFYYY